MFKHKTFLAILSAFLLITVLVAPVLAAAGDTTRVSVASDGTQGNDQSMYQSISADGRYVAFMSGSTNLVSGDTNGLADIFVHDWQTGTTTRVSVASDGTQSNGSSYYTSISADGRYVAFTSMASNLVNGDTNNKTDAFVHDRQTGETTRVSVASDGTQGNSSSDFVPSISADGRYVAFYSPASNLVSGDTNGTYDTFVHDRQTSITTRVSVASDGTQGNNGSYGPSISVDGRYVAFYSSASNLVSGDTNGANDIFVHDLQTGTTIRVSVASDGTQGNSGSYFEPSISSDGRYVAFDSIASNLVSGDTNGNQDTFVHDLQTGTTIRVSVASDGTQANYGSEFPSISIDGRYVTFESSANNLVSGDTNGFWDVFVHDLQTSITTRVSVASDETQGNNGSFHPAISADGRYVVFQSLASNLVFGDSNEGYDIFVHDLDPHPHPVITGNAGIAGATLTYINGIPNTTTTDSSGDYSFEVSYNWSGTATPSLAGYTFSPASIDYENVLSDQTEQDYTATAITYTISGNTGVAGASLGYTDGTPKTATSDGVSGDYSFEVSYNWSGTVTPSLAGFTFSPDKRVYVTVRADQTGQDYFTYIPLSGTTTRVSVASDGTQGNSLSLNPSISADGRYVAFDSIASNLVSGDTNGYEDVFVHDWQTGTTTRVSVASDCTQANNHSFYASISANGRYVAFTSSASNLVSGDTNGVEDVFVHDRQTATTTRVSIASDGTQGNDSHINTQMENTISADGRYVAFISLASNLVSGDTNGYEDVFVHDRQTGTTTRVSVASDGTQGNNFSGGPSISDDGRYVAFYSHASNLVSDDTNGAHDIFVHDLQTGTTTRVSVASDGTQGNSIISSRPSISSDGRYVAFDSLASNLVSGDTNGAFDVFVHDRQTGETSRVSLASDNTQGNNSSGNPSISADGRYVTFYSPASNLVSGDTNGYTDIFVYERQTSYTTRVSVASDGTQGNNNVSLYLSISADGRYVAFTSSASNLVNGDTNSTQDVFVHDRDSHPLPTMTGNAGVAGVSLDYTDGIPKTATSDGVGDYSFEVSYNWSGTVTPTKVGYTFNPSNRSYSNIVANQTNQGYTATAITYTISGNAGVAGATLSYTDGTAKTVTADGTGNYSLIVSYNWSGTVAPTKVGYTFIPVNRPYSNIVVNQTNQDYTATAITPTISGNVGVAGAGLGYTDGTPKTTTADGAGDYSFEVSYNWSGTVTPSLAGYTFVPINRTYSNVQANQSDQNFIVLCYTLTKTNNPSGGGTVDADPSPNCNSGTQYTDGTGVELTATANSGYNFSNWSGDASSTDNPVSVTMDAAKSITVNFTLSPVKAITAFNFNALSQAVVGVVNESAKTVALNVPYGTNVTALVPTITITGASINPASGVAQNFTWPVTYTVTAADTTTQAYTVTVTVAPNPAKAITTFDFDALSPVVTGVVNESAKTVALTVPYGTNVTTLVPTIIITGASINPASGVAQNFTSQVTYTITATDATTQAYTVTVTVAAIESPTNVQASDGKYTDKVQVRWNASIGATSYEVYRATSTIGLKNLLGSPTGTTFDDTTATPAVTYTYWVKACSGAICSDYSASDTGWRNLTVTFGEGSIPPSDGANLHIPPSILLVRFSENVLSNGSVHAANSLLNYMLVRAGTNGVFDTTVTSPSICNVAHLPAGDDEKVDILNITYNATTFTARIIVSPSFAPLANGQYRLYLCGAASIWDLNNNPINGGANVAINFSVSATPTPTPPPTLPLPTLPDTGFAPNKVTLLPRQSVPYAALGDLWLEIPKLGVQMPIVGVSQENGNWDVSWLGNKAGWLQGTAFPTLSGNSVITGHVWNADNKAGPFVSLNILWYGDRIIVHAWGQEYIYEVRSVMQVRPDTVTAAFQHRDTSWLTLTTCRSYDEVKGTYRYRVLVQAELVEIK